MSKKFKNPIDPPRHVEQIPVKVESDTVEGWYCNAPLLQRVPGITVPEHVIMAPLCLTRCDTPTEDCQKVRARVEKVSA